MASPQRRAMSPCLGPALALLLASCASSHTNAANPAGPSTLNVADAAIAGGDPGMALSVTRAILASAPDNVDALIHEGNAYYALQRCPAADAAYQVALHYDPHATQAQTGLGRCLLKTDPHAAELAFTQALADDPNNADALNDLGIARDLQGNFAGAVVPYSRALLADPSMTAAEVNLGLSLALSGNGPEALQYLGPLATGQGATPKIREDYAAALLASGRQAEARQVLSIDLPPDQVRQAMRGFSQVIVQSEAALPPAPALTEAPVAPVAAPPRGHTLVQLGAFNSRRLAEQVWQHLDARDPALFAGRTPEITSVIVKRRVFYRLRVAGFENDAAASRFCGAVAAASACTLADF
ncbi:MAG TPA: tetratricopeptide repeat protein [Acidocella sp.]|uniref:SPOR domain-containing protein n=1 Tax=Acidocella sp. TaxID=50710 RepID=UPI002D0F737E|nr:tetratricopeptide repeat protein [Acidocella sp.]HVE22906.1 tetratricopeptide repeat protein [Acidocella sp.]